MTNRDTAGERWAHKTGTSSWDLFDMLCCWLSELEWHPENQSLDAFISAREPEAGWVEDWPNGKAPRGRKTHRTVYGSDAYD